MEYTTRTFDVANDNDGFAMIPYAVFDVFGPAIGANGIVVYGALVCFANQKTQSCFPSLATLAKKAQVSKSTAQRYLGILRDVGLLRIVQQRKSDKSESAPNLYVLVNIRDAVAGYSHCDYTPSQTDHTPIVTQTIPIVTVTTKQNESNKTKYKQESIMYREEPCKHKPPMEDIRGRLKKPE